MSSHSTVYALTFEQLPVLLHCCLHLRQPFLKLLLLLLTMLTIQLERVQPLKHGLHTA